MSEEDLPRHGYRRCEVCGEELIEDFVQSMSLSVP